MEGDVYQAVELLRRHSEIAMMLQSEERQQAPYKAQCMLLFELIVAHPYAAIITRGDTNDASGEESKNTNFDQSYDKSFAEWQTRVKRLRGNGTGGNSQRDMTCIQLTARIPEMDVGAYS
jgi:hypothetical protein